MDAFAAYIPVGPRHPDVARALDLIQSLLYYEPETPHILIVDDTARGDTDWQTVPRPSTCTLHAIRHPRVGRAFDDHGAVCTANFVALGAAARLDVAFLLKLDTDALVIGPCARAIHDRFQTHPDCALLGALGHSCNRAVRSFHGNQELLAAASRAIKISSRMEDPRPDDLVQTQAWGIETEDQRLALARAAWIFLAALDSGFDGHHCQGGAYAMSAALLQRLSDARLLDDPLLWTGLPFGEDRVMALCAAAVELRVEDFSDFGEPFAVQASGLPYAPQDLVARGHSVTHSVRNDGHYSEADIRQFFGARREIGSGPKGGGQW